MKASRREFVKSTGAWAALAAAAPEGAPAVRLFNGRNLDGWYTFLRTKGVGHDPEGVFKVEDRLLHVRGSEFGYVCTQAEYDDFHLTVEFKWGEKRFPPREKAKRDSGILYRFPAGHEDRIWPRSIECQIQEGDTGDFWLVNGTSIVAGGATETRYFQKTRDAEKPRGEWNRVEVIADGGRCAHLVNGVLVNEGTGASDARGRIVLQSEGAEVFYRTVELRPLRGPR